MSTSARQRRRDQLAAALSVGLLVVLAGFSYYLAELSDRFPRFGAEGKPRHEPDYFVEGFALTKLNDRGEPTFRMSGERLVHFPDDDSTEFTRPTLISLDPAKPRITLSANRGRTSGKGEQTHLHDRVVLTRAGDPGKPPLRLTTDYLLLLADRDIARTDQRVRIEYGDSVLTGVGMEFDNAARSLELLSKVEGRWVGPAARPTDASQ